MKAEVADTQLFRRLFQYVARFIEFAHFDLSEDAFRVRSIDPHDFCYVDLVLYPSFFESYLLDNNWSFSVDCSKLASVFSSLTAKRISVRVEDGQMELSTRESWASSFSIRWLRPDIFDLPEPETYEYEATLDLTAKELADLIQKASAISHEIIFSAPNSSRITVMADEKDYSFAASPISPHFKVKVKSHANASVIVDYLKSLRHLIMKCDSARISFGTDKPLKLDLKYGNRGLFSFSFSHKRPEQKVRGKPASRAGASLPRISMKNFILYVVQLSRYPEGANPELFDLAGLETKGRDNWRLASRLAFAYKDGPKIKLTPIGEAFVSLYEKDERKAKQFLHMVARDSVVPYRVLVEEIDQPIALDEIQPKINEVLRGQNRPMIDGQDTSTLIEIAKWCCVLVGKSGLKSFASREKC